MSYTQQIVDVSIIVFRKIHLRSSPKPISYEILNPSKQHTNFKSGEFTTASYTFSPPRAVLSEPVTQTLIPRVFRTEKTYLNISSPKTQRQFHSVSVRANANYQQLILPASSSN
ncbi:hypothetical protein CEXT_603331 [Caerostris extrusa]|uniref:Uncharacterized protein n=1 Tax=Caerostris extrusa TaxID=172846 RepID=A0AAV4N7Q1_CAEEX|nr:hypothetical protein CEXT_603331 [Caerostris extrusa]